ncbi:hypothetical protein [Candidatus Thiothrix anitrata]|uniref:Alpha/beta hydrolase n=1 Tax=Candidatus Thiothrix anitrata TaxID=2823902 RepID=A0ABX7X858_9GAMM|nr:hypothetical protein [Candidatus Thiothrix anitrata]QTR50460.1 hypothetical protein J8380_02425 [Candidatus Thiothrix anitrata]
MSYRHDAVVKNCPEEGCKSVALERHADYDIGFVEFTDRGNVFDRAQMMTVLEHIQTQARTSDGAAVVVFVHGWKHNASSSDPNLDSFRKMLQQTAIVDMSGKRRLIGVYVGWRGKTLKVPVVENLTYWARKNTALSVGKGGVTELLLRLEHTLLENSENDPNRNVLLSVGHSFGGLILVSALHDVLLDRVLSTKSVGNAFCGKTNQASCATCVKTRPFGHGVILLNPAVEANELLPLKETVAEEQCYAQTQQKLLHVVSSAADIATGLAFRLGQYWGVSIAASELPLRRVYRGKQVVLHEHELDTVTVGNYPPFRSGISERRTPQNEMFCAGASKRSECYIVCKEGGGCFGEQDGKRHIPIGGSEPLHFLYTDADFIKDHNDVFNDTVAGYLAATVLENSYKRLWDQQGSKQAALNDSRPACLNHRGDDFDFAGCFDHYKKMLSIDKAESAI